MFEEFVNGALMGGAVALAVPVAANANLMGSAWKRGRRAADLPLVPLVMVGAAVGAAMHVGKQAVDERYGQLEEQV